MTPIANDTEHRPAAPVVATPRVVEDAEQRPVTATQAERIAPFVAWMATQDLGEATRRAHRESVEAFLTWFRTDDGPANGRRRRYEHQLDRTAPQQLGAVREGLDRYTQYRELVAVTLPIY